MYAEAPVPKLCEGSMPLTLTTRHCGNIYIIQCAGRILYGEEERSLGAVFNHAEHEFCRFVLGLAEITRLDSMGVGLLVRHNMLAVKRGGGIHLAAAPPFVTSLLELTQLTRTIPNFATEDEAIMAFLNRASPPRTDAKHGPRLLVFDPSADLCVFARSVLSQRGFDVRTTCAFGDAKLLLRAGPVDYVLVGPGTPQLPADTAARDLASIAPRASVLQLGADFKSHDALTATETLLELFGIAGNAPPALES